MEHRKKIDDIFKDELGSYAETPPAAVWDALENKLDTRPNSSRKPRLPFMWIGYLAAIALLLFAGYTLNNHAAKDAIAIATTNNMKNDNSKSLPHNDNGNHSPNRQDALIVNNNDNGAINTAKNTSAATNNGDQQLSEQNSKEQDGRTKSNHRPRTSAKQTGNFIASNSNHHDKNGITNKAGTSKSEDADNEIATTSQHENIYNSSTTENTDKPLQEEKKEEPEKPNPSPSKSKPAPVVSNPAARHQKPKFRFEAGIKGGYEAGFSSNAAQKGVLAPYLQYNISKKFAVMLQPAVKVASLGSRTIGQPRTFYKKNNDGILTAHTDSTLGIGVPWGDTVWEWNYRYTETHDSIVKSNVTGGTYVEIELPILLKYNISKDFSIYGGFNILYSKLLGLTEQTYIAKNLGRSVYGTEFGPAYSPAPVPDINITYTGLPYASYTGPQYAPATGYQLHFGYTIGFSYEFTKRWLFDALIEQSPVRQNLEGGYNTNATLSAPYFRFTLGYKILQVK